MLSRIWTRTKPAAVPPQKDSDPNPEESLSPQQVPDATRDDSKKEEDNNVLPSEVLSHTDNVDQTANGSSILEAVRMEQQQSDTPLGEAPSSRHSAQEVQPSPGSDEGASNVAQDPQATFENQTSAPGDHPSLPGQPVNTQDPGNTLRNRWSRLANAADSMTGDLILASDRRREAIEKRRVALRAIQEHLETTQDPSLLHLRDVLSDLQSSEQKLLHQDEDLVPRGDDIVAQGSKIFGVEADTSLEILDAQGIFVPPTATATDPSVLSADDIRLDRTSEARQYLSRKGDVDLLRETLMTLDGEQDLASTFPEVAMPADQLESRRQQLVLELEQAEADLETLHNNLPDRKVEIPDDQLRSLPTNEDASSQHDRDSAIGGETSGQALRASTGGQQDDQTESLSQILEHATDESHVRPETLVNAYLLYQLRRSPEEREAFLKTVEEKLKSENQAGRADTINDIPLEYWFDDEKGTKKSKKSQISLTKYIFSQPRSNMTDMGTAEYGPLTHGNSEPADRREHAQHDPREEFRQHRLLARQKAKGTNSLH
ncbi:hypothetical protein G647_09795 [Cladophialophora carrionii CBS 160.54]|uniref:Uncharacterized protein n=1 Tax=Cladophialophora carrionii CBS 160.54 TaxID=1279043 RepID=V9DL98_9EURO|nr:uncharacterized protein G647_09795 [Cladophialophora carrionii CBS 160.54]ETI27113.1 hypothetical protein G647_09795 [Cladophialophora carrionii CBS 160.54]